MKFKYGIKIWLVAGCLLALTGCFDSTTKFDLTTQQAEVITIHHDPKESSFRGPNEGCEKRGGEFTTLANGDTQCRLQGPFKLREWLAEGEVIMPQLSTGRKIKHRNMPIKIKAIDAHTLSLSLDTTRMLKELKAYFLPKKDNSSMQGVMLELLRREAGEGGLTLEFVADKVLSSNGNIAADGKSVRFFVPLTAMINEQNSLPAQFTAKLEVKDMLTAAPPSSGVNSNASTNNSSNSHARSNSNPQGALTPRHLSGGNAAGQLVTPYPVQDAQQKQALVAAFATPAGQQWLILNVKLAVNDALDKVSMDAVAMTMNGDVSYQVADTAKARQAVLQLQQAMAAQGLAWHKVKMTIMQTGDILLEPLK